MVFFSFYIIDKMYHNINGSLKGVVFMFFKFFSLFSSPFYAQYDIVISVLFT